MYTLRLLGGFALEGPTTGQHARLPQRRAEAVLAVLAVVGDMGCTRHRLLGLLWPDTDETHARHSLRDALHLIRQTLGAEGVLAEGDALRLNPAVLTSDVARFRQSVHAAPLEEATRAYRGPLLHGFFLNGAREFEQWVEAERARLAREYADAVERLATEAETAGRPREAAAWWARAIEHDPYNTRLVIRRMRALAAAGDRANALIEADVHARRLRTELEIEPDPALAAEVAALRSGGNGGSAPAVAARPAQPPHAPAPTAEPAGAGLRSAPTTRWRRIAWSAAAALAVATLATGWWWTRRVPPPLDLDLIAVLPFTTAPASPALEAEAAHVRQVVTRFLQVGPAPRAVEPAPVRKAWSRAHGNEASRDPRAVDARVARATGAALVLRGSLDSSAGGRALTLTLVELPRRMVLVRRTAMVPAAQLEAAVERLALEVLALEAGEPEHRLTELLAHDRAAVRLYLTGARRTDLYTSCPTWQSQVLRADSSLIYPVLACLGLGVERRDGPELDAVLAGIWRNRTRLAKEDQGFVEALIGPRFGLADDAEQRILLWWAAVNAAPEWWLPRGYFAFWVANFGSMTTMPAWESLAVEAVKDALDASEWSRLPVLEMGLWMGMMEGDSGLARRAARAAETRARRYGAGLTTPWGGWWLTKVWEMPGLVDAVFGPGLDIRRWREFGGSNVLWDRSPGAPGLGSPGAMRQLFALFLSVPRVAPFVDSLAARRERGPEMREPGAFDQFHAMYWRARGRFDEWVEHRRRDYLFPLWRAQSDPITGDAAWLRAVIYLGLPEDTVATLVVSRMRRIVEGDTVTVPDVGVTGIAHCWVAQWRLSHGDTTGVARAVAYLRNLEALDGAGAFDGPPSKARWVVCPALLDALTARVTGRDALSKARALDSVIRPMPIPPRALYDEIAGFTTHDQTRLFLENLLAARLLAEAGDTAAALAAVRRRPWWPVMTEWFEMPNEYLRLEGRLAAAMADTLTAVRAYEHYLGLRPERPAHPPWAAEWDSVRAELAALQPPRSP